jgi:hypothetical protein
MKKRMATLLALCASTSFCGMDWLTRTGEHEGGFFRLGLLGVAGASSSTTYPSGYKMNTGGTASLARIQFGWSIVPRVALHVNLIDLYGGGDSLTFQGYTWGPGITAYAPAGNFFATGVFGYSLVSFDGDKNGTGTQWYIGIGKEFMVSQYSGLGVMATLTGGSWEDTDSHQKWHQFGPGVQLTWTYN